MIRSLYRDQDGNLYTDVQPGEYATARLDEKGLLWVDLADESANVCRPILSETFGFHPLAVDDALEERHVPKLDDWGEYIYLVLHAVVYDTLGEDLVNTLELDVFLGPNYLVTYHTQPIEAMERVWAIVSRDERHLQKGAAYLLYTLTDELVSDYMPVVEMIDEAIDQIEDQVFSRPEPALLETIFSLKRALLGLRRIMAPQREVLNKLARGHQATITAEESVFFRDVYDHLVRLHDIVEGLRDLAGSALETYLSVTSNRMNEVMKTLTVITTLFMPISFLAGFFGMNFFQPDVSYIFWMSRPIFTLVIVGVVLIPAGMYFWMRKRTWM